VADHDAVIEAVQRGLARIVVRDGELCVEQTPEGRMVLDAYARKTGVPCLRCGRAYPGIGTLPKYSLCSDCRKALGHVRFYMERPRR
jgi:hypothetical protein